MQPPQTISEAIAIIAAQERELTELRSQQQDWINLVREFIRDSNVDYTRRTHFREGKR